jgi:hypothetical protein
MILALAFESAQRSGGPSGSILNMAIRAELSTAITLAGRFHRRGRLLSTSERPRGTARFLWR